MDDTSSQIITTVVNPRFKLLTDEDRKKLGAKAVNKNTVRSTRTWIKTFAEWAKTRNKKTCLEEYLSKEDLDETLGCFYSELVQKNGKEYEPDCLRVMQGSLQRHLNDKNIQMDIIDGVDFRSSQRILEGKARSLREMGMGKKPNASDALTLNEENMLWETGRLGRSSPVVLVRTIWFLLVQHFGLRGVQEHTTMRMDEFKRRVSDDGETYIEFVEDPTKTRGRGLRPKNRPTDCKMFPTNDDRCPIRIFDFYVSKRPASMADSERFYLIPKPNWHGSDWYYDRPMGHNSISSIMKKIVENTHIPSTKKITNHSGRKTVVKKLKKAKIAESSIIKVTGHTTTKGLNSYDPGDEDEFREMSHAISTGGSRAVQPASSSPIDFTISPAVSDSRPPQKVQAMEGGLGYSFQNCSVTINNTTNFVTNQNKRKLRVIYDSSSDCSQE